MKLKLSSLFLVTLMSLAGMNVWALEPNGKGVYEIGSPEDLMAFSELVNAGNTAANAVMTANIDMAGIANFVPIGSTEALPYIGTFDGQGHKFSNFTINAGIHAGMFSYVSGGVTVKNLIFDKTCVVNATSGGYAGIIGGSIGSGPITIQQLGNEGKVTAAGPNAGGIIGVNSGSAASFIIENCYVTGTITGVNESGAITGWAGNSRSSISNSWSTATVTGYDEGLPFCRPAITVIKNCYNLTGEQATKMTMKQLASGEIAYLLNEGMIENVAWYQSLNEDALPVLDNTHKKVYKEGTFTCDGTMLSGSGQYTNNSDNSVVPPHEYEDGICKNCSGFDPNYIEIVKGVYQIGTPKQLVYFSKYVTAEHYGVSACLTADLDMSCIENFPPIAPSTTNDTSYRGIFDGQGHTISNLNIHTDANNNCYVGLFSCATSTEVKNVFMKNTTITTDSQTPVSTGPLMGRNSSSVIQNVGVVGTTFNQAAVGEKTTATGGVIGYASSNANTLMNYCFTDYATWGAKGGKATATGCYAGDKAKEMGASGELCYTLNSVQPEFKWYQTLGEDEYPVFTPSHGTVVQMPSAGYSTLFVPTSDVALSAGVEAYAGVVTGQVLWLKHALQAVPAATAVVLKGNGYYSITPTTGAQAPAENDLKGTAEPLEATGTQYVLAEKDGTVGFYQAIGTIPAGKAYVEYAGAAGVKGFAFGIADGINSLTPAPSPVGEGNWYDLSGRHVEKATKGIYIVNGKKIMK